MIREGSKGSLNLYYKSLLISSYPLTNKKTFDNYFYQGEYLIRKSKHIPIKLQIKTYLNFCNVIHRRKFNNQPIRKTDHEMFLNSLFALMRLNIIENDESNGYLIMNKKKC